MLLTKLNIILMLLMYRHFKNWFLSLKKPAFSIIDYNIWIVSSLEIGNC